MDIVWMEPNYIVVLAVTRVKEQQHYSNNNDNKGHVKHTDILLESDETLDLYNII
jgi:hypothetical protein